MDSVKKLFDDIADMARAFKLPGGNFDALLKARRKDLEALLEVGRIAQSGVQSLAQKQAYILRSSLEDLRNVLTGAGKMAGTQLEAARAAAEKAVANVAELALIALQSQSDAFDTVRRRAEENIQELRALMSQPSQPK